MKTTGNLREVVSSIEVWRIPCEITCISNLRWYVIVVRNKPHISQSASSTAFGREVGPDQGYASDLFLSVSSFRVAGFPYRSFSLLCCFFVFSSLLCFRSHPLSRFLSIRSAYAAATKAFQPLQNMNSFALSTAMDQPCTISLQYACVTHSTLHIPALLPLLVEPPLLSS